jgi:hypothetical protein
MQAFLDSFLLISVSFVVMLPLILLMRSAGPGRTKPG